MTLAQGGQERENDAQQLRKTSVEGWAARFRTLRGFSEFFRGFVSFGTIRIVGRLSEKIVLGHAEPTSRIGHSNATIPLYAPAAFVINHLERPFGLT